MMCYTTGLVSMNPILAHARKNPCPLKRAECPFCLFTILWLYRNIEHFPLVFILTTGAHENVGIQWQGMYIDHKHTVYFFDSYGRKPSNTFHRFAHDLLTVSYYRDEYMNDISLKQALSDTNVTQTNLQRCHKAKEVNGEDDTIRYFPYQIQNDKTSVCGEYAVLFLHNITRSRDPWLHAYHFWT